MSFGVGWRGVGLNVAGRVLRDRGIGNCGRESLSVLFGDRLDRVDRFDRFLQPRAAALGEFGGIFFCCFGFFLYFCCVVFCIYTLFCVET